MSGAARGLTVDRRAFCHGAGGTSPPDGTLLGRISRANGYNQPSATAMGQCARRPIVIFTDSDEHEGPRF